MLGVKLYICMSGGTFTALCQFRMRDLDSFLWQFYLLSEFLQKITDRKLVQEILLFLSEEHK